MKRVRLPISLTFEFYRFNCIKLSVAPVQLKLISFLQYVRLDKDTEMDDILDFMKKDWRLQKPKVLLSVTGATQDFSCSKQKKIFQGIVNAAVDTG